MRKSIFYLFVFPMYVFLMLENLKYLSVVSIVVILYLCVSNVMLVSKSKMTYFSSIVFFVNNLIIYPFLLQKFKLNFSITFIVVLVFIVMLYLLDNFYSINRDIVILFLTISTLNCSLYDLYINVNQFRTENLLFLELMNYLWFTSSNSSKMIKRVSKRSKKSKED